MTTHHGDPPWPLDRAFLGKIVFLISRDMAEPMQFSPQSRWITSDLDRNVLSLAELDSELDTMSKTNSNLDEYAHLSSLSRAELIDGG